MHIRDIQLLYDYNYWASNKVMQVASGLAVVQLNANISQSHDSLRGIFVHILSAEWVWRLRCQEGVSPSELLPIDEFPSIEDIMLRANQEEAAMRAYLAGLNGRDLDRTVFYARTGGERQANTLWYLLVHVVLHGTEHRSQIAELLTGFGRSPGDIDFIHFLRERD